MVAKSKRAQIRLNRPPLMMSAATLAYQLDISESTLRDLVKRGILPPAIVISSGVVRWNWEAVQASFGAMRAGRLVAEDAYLAGAHNAAQA